MAATYKRVLAESEAGGGSREKRIDRARDAWYRGFVADARAPLEDVSAAVGTDLSALVDTEEVDTLGGFITAVAGRVPVRGEIIPVEGLEFEIVDADPRRLKRILHHRTKALN